VVDNPSIAGVALWQFCDGRTYRGSHALGRPRAFNNKGTVDEYRRPKLAYEAVKAIFKEAAK
jgi:beta-glucuronidase